MVPLKITQTLLTYKNLGTFTTLTELGEYLFDYNYSIKKIEEERSGFTKYIRINYAKYARDMIKESNSYLILKYKMQWFNSRS